MKHAKILYSDGNIQEINFIQINITIVCVLIIKIITRLLNITHIQNFIFLNSSYLEIQYFFHPNCLDQTRHVNPGGNQFVTMERIINKLMFLHIQQRN